MDIVGTIFEKFEVFIESLGKKFKKRHDCIRSHKFLVLQICLLRWHTLKIRYIIV